MSMSHKYDFCIIHKNERCHWMALELARQNFQVALVDLSSSEQVWAPEDWEGPFGVLKSPQLEASQWSLLTDSRLVRESERGFVVWTNKTGPLELKGPLYSFHKGVYPELGIAEDYFQEADMAQPEKVELLNHQLSRLGFHKNWLVQLGHNFAAQSFLSNAESIRSKRPYPLYYNYIVRGASHKEHAETLDRLEAAGVRVFRKAEVKDISIDKKRIVGAEISTQNFSQFVQAENWVWCLSEQESFFHFPKLYDSLFAAPPILPQWAWIRYRIKFEENPCLGEIPTQCLMIQDIHASWSHANFMQCIRTELENEFDFWVRVPELERYRKEYLLEIQQKIFEHIFQKIPGGEILSSYMPQEYYYSSEELGPALYSIYEDKSLEASSHRKFKNLFFDGPHFWARLDEVYRLLLHQKTLREWKEKREENQHDSALHSTRDGKDLDA